MRKFNVLGNCVKRKHYMVDTSEKLTKIKAMVDDELYFTINRARQYGKTTTLYLLREALKTEYICIKISFEGEDCMFASSETFCKGFLTLLDKNMDSSLRGDIKWKDESVTDFGALNLHIDEVCENKKIVLMIDEVDKASDNLIFLRFLGMLRNKYLARNGGDGYTFHSVILAGVHDIKNIKQKMITQGLHTQSAGEGSYNSPWNIAADFNVDMSFNPQEISTMLAEYEKDHNTGMNIAAISEEIYGYTSGYPYLVSRICQYIDENLGGDWSADGVQQAVAKILKEKNTLFDDLFKNLGNIDELSDLVYRLLILGEKFSFTVDNPMIDFGMMYGIFAERGGDIVISNRIFEIRITEYLISKDALKNKRSKGILREDVVNNGKFDMETTLRKFAEHYYETFTEEDVPFLERHGRLLFLSYLKPLINGVGFYYIEAQTRNERRMDIVVDYNKEQFIIELKLWHGDKYKEKAYEQLLEYMSAKNIDTGYLLTFDFRKGANKERKADWVEFDGKRIFDVVV